MIITMHIGEFKSRFSEVVEMIKEGKLIRVIKGKSGELVGYFGKELVTGKKINREIGFFEEEEVSVSMSDLHWSKQELEDMGL
ncbi:hypothetical protein [uncultured Algoriphagus sp.]|uniref:hypothetical protein n=1 Tax=uncultured Algoriphagus sp. TaxID=417365 RepID=UPI00259615BF|nr:hypothetical protein [uncultured Algoriphagus sp.]